jgi:hypothetical protein
MEGGRAARPRPCGWEPLMPLATVPARTGTGGIRICRNGHSGQKRCTQDRGFAKSEHMTPSSVSSASVEWTLHEPLIISPGLNRLFWIAE